MKKITLLSTLMNAKMTLMRATAYLFRRRAPNTRNPSMEETITTSIRYLAAMILGLLLAAAPRAAILWSGVLDASVMNNPRAQVADIVDVGPSRFATGYVRSDGSFYYAYFSTGGGEVAQFQLGGGGAWVRGNTSKYLSRANACGKFSLFVNFTTAQSEGSEVYLDEHSACGASWRGVTFQHVASGAMSPSVATMGTLSSGKALIVYGVGDQLWGRFYNLFWDDFLGRRDHMGDPFLIQQLSPGAILFSSDVIYNTVSSKFIVGYVERSNGNFCRIKNIVLSGASFPPAIEAPTHFGVCDSDVGGHHTSVGFSTQSTDGTYAWWRQGMDRRKSVFIHDQNGQLAPFAPVTTDMGFGGTTWTTPVCGSSSASHPYLFVKGCFSALFAFKSDKSVEFFENYGTCDRQIAVRSLSSHTASLHAIDGGQLLLSLSDKP